MEKGYKIDSFNGFYQGCSSFKKIYMTSKNCRHFKGEMNHVTKDPQVLGPNIQNLVA